MAKYRSYSLAFKRPVAQEYLGGETLHGIARRHDVARNLIRIWVAKYEAGAFDDDAQAADLIQEYEARIAALERLVGKQALELEFPKGALKSAPRPIDGLHPRSSARRSLPRRRMPADGDAALDLLRQAEDCDRRYSYRRGDGDALPGVRSLRLPPRPGRAAAAGHRGEPQKAPAPDARARSAAEDQAPLRPIGPCASRISR